MLSLPIQLTDTVVVGPNILDLMKRELTEVWEETAVSTPDSSLQTSKTKVEKQNARHSDEILMKSSPEYIKLSGVFL